MKVAGVHVHRSQGKFNSQPPALITVLLTRTKILRVTPKFSFFPSVRAIEPWYNCAVNQQNISFQQMFAKQMFHVPNYPVRWCDILPFESLQITCMNIVVQWNLYKQTSMKLSPSLRLLVVTHADTLYKVLEIISKNYCKSYLYLAVNTIKRLWPRSTTYESTNYKRTTGELAIWLTTDNRLTVTIDGSKRTNYWLRVFIANNIMA